MDKSKLHDQVVQKAIRTIQETELIAHGYKLYPLLYVDYLKKYAT